MPLPSRKSLLLWLSGLASAAVLLGLGALIVAEGGLYDVAASTPDPAVQAVVVHTTMIRSVQTQAATIEAPPRFTSAQIEAGCATTTPRAPSAMAARASPSRRSPTA